MRGRPGGSIVNIASELGIVGHALCAAYCASKGGVIQLTRAIFSNRSSAAEPLTLILAPTIRAGLLTAERTAS